MSNSNSSTSADSDRNPSMKEGSSSPRPMSISNSSTSADWDRNPSTKEGSSSPEDYGQLYDKADKRMQTPVYAGEDYSVGGTVSTLVFTDRDSLEAQLRRYRIECISDTGSFGTVFRAKCLETGKIVAIKKVQKNNNYKSRELRLLQNMNYPNIIPLESFFYTTRNDKLCLNLVMEYLPMSLHRLSLDYHSANQMMPLIYVKLYTYQMFRALSYLHHVRICHRDVKPRNLLVNQQTNQVKLCDFGSAKELEDACENVSNIGSRRYRAPELLYGAKFYTTAVDMWSAGCVLAGLLLGEGLFDGEEEMIDQIALILGVPTQLEIRAMNLAATTEISGENSIWSWNQVFDNTIPPEAISLVAMLIQYNPTLRGTALEACAHPFFDELRQPNFCLPNRQAFPPLFDFQRELKDATPSLVSRLIPAHLFF